MWEKCLEKLARLKNFDRQFQAFGADAHRYLLQPPVEDDFVSFFEADNRFQIPLELRRFYTEVGDGVAGPGYGLTPMFRLDGFRPHLPYEDYETLKQRNALQYGRAALAGLLTIVEEGCGHQVCLVATGEMTGRIVYLSEDGALRETSLNFLEFYEAWLDAELEKFEFVEKMMRAGANYATIGEALLEKFGEYNAGDLIASIADAEKPVELFGTPHRKIYHGAVQAPWYEKVLRNWQENNS